MKDIKDNFIFKHEWVRRHKKFAVTVTTHNDGNKWHWATYCYIYPGSPLFEEYKNLTSMFDVDLEGNWYCSFLHFYFDHNGEVTCIKCGWDYNHDGETYTEEGPEEHNRAFYVANSLYDQLIERVKDK